MLKMKFTRKYSLQVLSKIILLVVFIPIIIAVLFIAVPIIMSIVCVVLMLMFFTGKRLNHNTFSFKFNKNPFNTSKRGSTEQQEHTEYYDAEYISLDNITDKK
jgi:hypothetical protein